MPQDDRLNDDFLKKALANQHGIAEVSIEILDWTCAQGAAPEDNFTCDMVSVKGHAKWTGQDHDFSYMVKLAPKGEMQANMVASVSIF
jgi:hypothetical protein